VYGVQIILLCVCFFLLSVCLSIFYSVLWTLRMVSYKCAIVTLSLRLVSMYITAVTLKPGLGSLKVIETDMYRSATYSY